MCCRLEPLVKSRIGEQGTGLKRLASPSLVSAIRSRQTTSFVSPSLVNLSWGQLGHLLLLLEGRSRSCPFQIRNFLTSSPRLLTPICMSSCNVHHLSSASVQFRTWANCELTGDGQSCRCSFQDAITAVPVVRSVNLSLSLWKMSLWPAWNLYLPWSWCTGGLQLPGDQLICSSLSLPLLFWADEFAVEIPAFCYKSTIFHC